jgi:hypothetical protein
MSVLKTEKALIKHLNLLTPALPTAYEAASFTPPTTIYQRVQFRVNQPDDPVLGTGYYRERIEMQIFVNAPTNKGTGEALSRAEILRQHFKKSTTLPEAGVLVHVLETPHISGTIAVGDRIICPVLISATAEVLV